MTSRSQPQSLASAIGWVPPENWPARSRAECRAILTAPGERFEMEDVEIRGTSVRTWKNAPANLRAIAMLGQSHGQREFVIYEDERITYDAWFRAVAALAHEFRKRGIAKGDRVALAMRKGVPMVDAIRQVMADNNFWNTEYSREYRHHDDGPEPRKRPSADSLPAKKIARGPDNARPNLIAGYKPEWRLNGVCRAYQVGRCPDPCNYNRPHICANCGKTGHRANPLLRRLLRTRTTGYSGKRLPGVHRARRIDWPHLQGGEAAGRHHYSRWAGFGLVDRSRSRPIFLPYRPH